MSFDRTARESQMDRTIHSMWSDGWGQTADTHEDRPISGPPARSIDMARLFQEFAATRGQPGSEPPSASELAYGATCSMAEPARTPPSTSYANGNDVSVSGNATHAKADRSNGEPPPTVEAKRRREAIERVERSYETADRAANAIDTAAPAYVAARDQLNAAAVAGRGGHLIETFGVVHGAIAALEKIQPTLPRSSVAGVDAEEAIDQFNRSEAIEHDLPALQKRVGHADATIASALTPHTFRGNEVAGRPVVAGLTGPFAKRSAALTGELQRTIEIVEAVHDVIAQLANSQRGLDEPTVDGARAKLARWAGRPLDLAFLRAALGPLWNALDTTAGGPLSTKPGDMMAYAAHQATDTGWLGDVGRFNFHKATAQLLGGGRVAAESVIADLYTADPDTRAILLTQIHRRGLLDRLCSAVGWKPIKELHDNLGYGFAEIKSALQPYFLGKGKFGPRLDSEWESHDSSLHSAVGRLGVVGDGLNVGLNLATFGFHGSYGQALDERSVGLTSESEARSAKQHAAARTAAIAVVSIATGGIADKAVRGGATTVSMGRAMVAGAAGGSVGAVTEVATADVYNNFISGTQDGASSVKDYVTAMLVGGAGGAALGGISQGLSRKSAASASELEVAIEPPTRPEKLTGANEAGHGNTSTASEVAAAKEWVKRIQDESPAAPDPRAAELRAAQHKVRDLNSTNYHAVQEGSVTHPNATPARLKEAVVGLANGERIPLTFRDSNQFAAFRTELAAVFESEGITDATVVQIGSATTGWKGNPQKYLDYKTAGGTDEGWADFAAWKPTSDTDFAVFSEQALVHAHRVNAPANSKYGVFKNGQPATEGFPGSGQAGFYNSSLGQKLYRLAAKWNQEIYGTPEPFDGGFDFKLNMDTKPFTTPPTIYKGPATKP